MFLLKGGPYNGQSMRMPVGASGTLDFNVGDWRGRYVLEVPGNVLHWQPRQLTPDTRLY